MNAPTNTEVLNAEVLTIKIIAIRGTEEAKESATNWLGRQSSNKNIPRKDLAISAEIPKIAATQLASLDQEKLAQIINDEWLAYIRRVKCQRLSIGDSVEIALKARASEYAEQVINMLSAPAERAKKLVSSSTVRALLLDEDYKLNAAAVMKEKLDAWTRIFNKEFALLATAQDAKCDSRRAKVRDNCVIRCMEIAERMKESEHKAVLSATAEILAELETIDLDDSI